MLGSVMHLAESGKSMNHGQYGPIWFCAAIPHHLLSTEGDRAYMIPPERGSSIDHDPFVAGTIRTHNADEVASLSLFAACTSHATTIPSSWVMGMNLFISATQLFSQLHPVQANPDAMCTPLGTGWKVLATLVPPLPKFDRGLLWLGDGGFHLLCGCILVKVRGAILAAQNQSDELCV